MAFKNDISNIFLICPVRRMTKGEIKFLEKEYLPSLERKGIKVHYPPRDTKQVDHIGINILNENLAGIKKSQQVHIFYNPTSEGSCFDLGETFMLEKMLEVINLDVFNMRHLSGFSEFERFMLQYAINTRTPHPSKFYKKVIKRRSEIQQKKVIEYTYNGLNPGFLFDLGMSYSTGKPIILTNRQDVKPTKDKSFENVLLALDEEYRK